MSSSKSLEERISYFFNSVEIVEEDGERAKKAIFSKGIEKHIIIIEPNEEMLGMIKRSLPQGVWQNN